MKSYAVRLDDGSLLVEWVDDTARFGLSFEPTLSESSWFYVSKSGGSGCGLLPLALAEYYRDIYSKSTKSRIADAAPELLAALIGLQHEDGCYCEAAFSMPDGSHPRHSPECEAARAAIAKAEGES